MELRFTVLAEADILDLCAYTFKTFGERQTDLYEASLRDALSSILANPQIGVDRSAIRLSTRRYLFEKHAIYYEVGEKNVLVLRILNVRQDPGRHL